MPLQQTSGNDTADAYGSGVSVGRVYIEDVFSTYLYTGNGSTQTITNGIDLSTKGGLVWAKSRSDAAYHGLSGPDFSTSYFGGYGGLRSNQTAALGGTDFAGVSTTGFNLAYLGGDMNFSGWTYASWTFREQPKFFDVVTYTGTGVNRTVAHNLGSVPGCIIVKRTDTTADWAVYHRSLANTEYLVLNTTAAVATGATWWNSTTPTSAVFSLGTDASVNASGGTYVAYIFAHDAGGFGLTGTDNVISCGSFTVSSGTGSTDVNLGYEPQWLLAKPSTDPGFGTNWNLYDTMRGWVNTTTAGNVNKRLNPNLSQQETSDKSFQPTATGFTMLNSEVYPGTSITYIYIAIRRGPMKVPTDGTKVYGAVSRAGTGANATVTTGSFPPDLTIIRGRDAGYSWRWGDRLRGASVVLRSNLTNAELTGEADLSSFNMDGFSLTGTGASLSNSSGGNYINYVMGRAPGFFDEVCYTGTGSNTTQTHNLGVVPELIIVKGRSGATAWDSYSSALANTEYVVLNTTAAKATGATRWNSTTPTASVFSIGTSTTTNASAETYVAYLFATCAGVSKVGSYTGNGTTQTINCGFTGGARFVLIKRTDSTGDWYVYDTARGMTVLTDPYLLLNDTAAEVATLGSVTTVSTGFALDSSILAAINVNAGTYIFLAIA